MRLLLGILFIVLSGCASKFSHKLDYNPTTPLRVAVLPFVQLDNKGQIATDEGRLFVDSVSLLSGGSTNTPAQLLRKFVLSELATTPLDLVAPVLIDIDLPHHGFAIEGGGIDVKKLYVTSPQELCEKFLTCDAVLYGRIKRWSRDYYGVESVGSIAFELQMVRAIDGATLFTTSAEDTVHRGLSRGPTGFSSLVIEPLRGLDNELVQDLARTMVKEALAPLKGKGPSSSSEPPPSIYAASHDGEKLHDTTEPILVLLYGTPGQQASFSIGTTVRNVPMIERSPGHYYGEYLPAEGDSFSQATVEITLIDAQGRSMRQPIEGKPVNQ